MYTRSRVQHLSGTGQSHRAIPTHRPGEALRSRARLNSRSCAGCPASSGCAAARCAASALERLLTAGAKVAGPASSSWGAERKKERSQSMKERKISVNEDHRAPGGRRRQREGRRGRWSVWTQRAAVGLKGHPASSTAPQGSLPPASPLPTTRTPLPCPSQRSPTARSCASASRSLRRRISSDTRRCSGTCGGEAGRGGSASCGASGGARGQAGEAAEGGGGGPEGRAWLLSCPVRGPSSGGRTSWPGAGPPEEPGAEGLGEGRRGAALAALGAKGRRGGRWEADGSLEVAEVVRQRSLCEGPSSCSKGPVLPAVAGSEKDARPRGRVVPPWSAPPLPPCPPLTSSRKRAGRCTPTWPAARARGGSRRCGGGARGAQCAHAESPGCSLSQPRSGPAPETASVRSERPHFPPHPRQPLPPPPLAPLELPRGPHSEQPLVHGAGTALARRGAGAGRVDGGREGAARHLLGLALGAQLAGRREGRGRAAVGLSLRAQPGRVAS
jgi:hypothetical protein